MRYAIVSDLHANLAAWQSVLHDLAENHADQIICLGDVVGYGPDPVEVLESVYQHVPICILGNHDAAVAGIRTADDFTQRAQEAVALHRKMLSSRAFAWLKKLPYTCKGKNFRCAHGDFSLPEEFRYILEPKEAVPSWQATAEQLLFVGHTHESAIFVIGNSGTPHRIDPCDFELEEGKRYIVNPGSVGFPRAGQCRSSYCLYDSQTRTIQFRFLPFDIVGYQAKLKELGITDDPWVEEEARKHQVKNVREHVSFAKPLRPRVVSEGIVSSDQVPASRGEAPVFRRQPVNLPPFLTRWWFLLTVAVLILAVGTVLLIDAFQFGKSTVVPQLAIQVPTYELSVVSPYPLQPPDKNWLPPWPSGLSDDGTLTGWRYELEDKIQQQFGTGLLNHRVTLVLRHQKLSRVSILSPIFDLSATQVASVRLNGRARKREGFQGSVQYSLVTYTTDKDGNRIQQKIEPFELRESRKKNESGQLAVSRKIPLAKTVTHIRFRIDGSFDGTIELEPPELRMETLRSR